MKQSKNDYKHITHNFWLFIATSLEVFTAAYTIEKFKIYVELSKILNTFHYFANKR